MRHRRWFSTAQKAASRYFGRLEQRVFSAREMMSIIGQNRDRWACPASTPARDVLEFLLERTSLFEEKLPCSYDGHSTTRYRWGEVSPFTMAVSLRTNSYLCYSTAAFLQGLTEDIPRILYLNKEQSPKPAPSGISSQAALDRAFSSKQRQSKLYYTWNEYRIFIINGKNSNNLGVVQESSEGLPVTSLERTLIDLAVRPAYSGGVHRVLDAYIAAKGANLSVITLRTVLKKLDYVYPYHQVVGYYLERAGFPEKSYRRFLEPKPVYNFYLDYNLRETDFVEKWKLFIPKGFEPSS